MNLFCNNYNRRLGARISDGCFTRFGQIITNSYKLNMAFAANLLENAMLVLARGVAFAHFVILHRRVFG